MNYRILFSALILFFGQQLVAQTKQLSLDDAVQQQYRKFYPEQTDGITPYAADDFTFVKDYNSIKYINGKTGKISELFNLEDINKARSVDIPAFNYFPYWDYNWQDNETVIFTLNNTRYSYNFKTKNLNKLIEYPEKAKQIHVCDNTGYTAYTIDNNLFFTDDKGKTVQVTNDKNKGIVNGSDYVHRQEFGITEGIFWSPDGKYLAFYRKDETMVADYPLVDITTRIATETPIKYPMIGEKSEEVTLGIYNLKTGKTIFADVTDFDAERYLTSITWSPDSKYIFIGVLNRAQNHLKMNKYDASNGQFIKTLFEEKNDRYVEPEHPLYFRPDSNNEFLYYSERDGYNHLYLYNTEGKLIKQVTKGEWVVLGLLGQDAENIYISATKESPIEQHAYKVNIKTGKITKLTQDNGVHSVVLSKSKKYLTDSYNNTVTPNRVTLKAVSGKEIKELLDADNPLIDYNLANIEIGKLKADDGKTDLYYRLITPPDFESDKTYPAIVYVYGGPHLQQITDSWLAGVRLWQLYMAQKGYVMFCLDNRGSDNRGFEFESIIHRQCGQTEMRDQMTGINYLKSLGYIDENRIGVHGWSYGGFMTTSLMTNYPETFKVGVAGGPVIDWKYYEVMYGERYMDTPAENPEGFKKTSLLNNAGNLKGRLLIIHGYQDPVVVPQNSIDFLRATIKADTDCDFYLYPESEHNVRGAKRTHLMRKVTRYFDDFLMPLN